MLNWAVRGCEKAGKGEKTNFIANCVALVIEDNQGKITPQQFPKSKKKKKKGKKGIFFHVFTRFYVFSRLLFGSKEKRQTTGDTVRREGYIWRISL